MKKFTLIELLVVVAIIGILAAMILPALGTARDKAQQKTCTNNLKQVGTAMIMYFSDGSETKMPAQALYLRSIDNAGVEWGNRFELTDGALSCAAKRLDGNDADSKVYHPCAGIPAASFAACEDPQTRIATDGYGNGALLADAHDSGKKANTLAGDGHVEPTSEGLAQLPGEL